MSNKIMESQHKYIFGERLLYHYFVVSLLSAGDSIDSSNYSSLISLRLPFPTGLFDIRPASGEGNVADRLVD